MILLLEAMFVCSSKRGSDRTRKKVWDALLWSEAFLCLWNPFIPSQRRDNPRTTDETVKMILFHAFRILLSCSDCKIVSEMFLVFPYSDFHLQ